MPTIDELNALKQQRLRVRSEIQQLSANAPHETFPLVGSGVRGNVPTQSNVTIVQKPANRMNILADAIKRTYRGETVRPVEEIGAGEAVGRGVLTGLLGGRASSPQQVGLQPEFGPEQDLRTIRPYTTRTGELAGFLAGMAPAGKAVGALGKLAKFGEATTTIGKIGQRAATSGAQFGVLGAGQSTLEKAAGIPNAQGQKMTWGDVAKATTEQALVGGVFGGAGAGGQAAVAKVASPRGKFLAELGAETVGFGTISQALRMVHGVPTTKEDVIFDLLVPTAMMLPRSGALFTKGLQAKGYDKPEDAPIEVLREVATDVLKTEPEWIKQTLSMLPEEKQAEFVEAFQKPPVDAQGKPLQRLEGPKETPWDSKLVPLDPAKPTFDPLEVLLKAETPEQVAARRDNIAKVVSMRDDIQREIDANIAEAERLKNTKYKPNKTAIADDDGRYAGTIGGINNAKKKRAIESALGRVRELKAELEAINNQHPWLRNEPAATQAKLNLPSDKKQPPEAPAPVTVEPTKPVAPATDAAKEPWQMTRDEYATDQRAEDETRSRKDSDVKRGVVGSIYYPDIEAVRFNHSLEVRSALKNGKPVPPEVLADYPDLKPATSSLKIGDTFTNEQGEFVVTGVLKDKGKILYKPVGDPNAKAQSMDAAPTVKENLTVQKPAETPEQKAARIAEEDASDVITYDKAMLDIQRNDPSIETKELGNGILAFRRKDNGKSDWTVAQEGKAAEEMITLPNGKTISNGSEVKVDQLAESAKNNDERVDQEFVSRREKLLDKLAEQDPSVPRQVYEQMLREQSGGKTGRFIFVDGVEREILDFSGKGISGQIDIPTKENGLDYADGSPRSANEAADIVYAEYPLLFKSKAEAKRQIEIAGNDKELRYSGQKVFYGNPFPTFSEGSILRWAKNLISKRSGGKAPSKITPTQESLVTAKPEVAKAKPEPVAEPSKPVKSAEEYYAEKRAQIRSTAPKLVQSKHIDTFVELFRTVDETAAKVRGMSLEDYLIERKQTHGDIEFTGGNRNKEKSLSQALGRVVKGQLEWKDGVALMRAYTQGDFSTYAHELSHYYRKTYPFSVQEMDAMVKEFGATKKVFNNRLLNEGDKTKPIRVQQRSEEIINWDAAAEEKFARAFERYLKTGKAPRPELTQLFAQMKEFMREIYRKVKGGELDIKLHPKIKAVFDGMFGKDTSEFWRGEERKALKRREVAKKNLESSWKMPLLRTHDDQGRPYQYATELAEQLQGTRYAKFRLSKTKGTPVSSYLESLSRDEERYGSKAFDNPVDLETVFNDVVADVLGKPKRKDAEFDQEETEEEYRERKGLPPKKDSTLKQRSTPEQGAKPKSDWHLTESEWMNKNNDALIRRYEKGIERKRTEIGALAKLKRLKAAEKESITLAGWERTLVKLKSGEYSDINKDTFRKQYRDFIKKSISTGKDVPQSVIDQYPEFKLAKTARERYEKGLHTSFGNRSAAINETMREERGYKVKRQDGKPITEEQINEISSAVSDIESIIGNLKDAMLSGDITIAHTSGKHPFLSDAGGQYHGNHHTVTIGINDKLGRPVKAAAHEIAHWFDHDAGVQRGVSGTAFDLRANKKYNKSFLSDSEESKSSDSLIAKATKKINNERELTSLLKFKPKELSFDQLDREVEAERARIQLGPYWRRPVEVFARLVEQYIATKHGKETEAAHSPEYYEKSPGYWTKEDFRELMPLVESEIKRRLDIVNEYKRPDDEAPFQLGDKKDLYVAHNLSEENLLHADELGGLAMPSIAIAKKGIGIEGFGEITLLAHRDLIDPKRKGNAVYDTDAYTPRQPRGETLIDVKKATELFDGDHVEAFQLEDDIKRDGLRFIDDNRRLAKLFLKEKGQDTSNLKYGSEFVDAAKKYGQEWSEFAQKTAKSLITGKRLFKGFTNAGKRRYAPYTLENVVREMRSKLKDGEGSFYGAGSVRAAAAKKFRSIKSIQAERDRLVPAEDVNKEEFNDRLVEIAESLKPYYKYSKENPFMYADQAGKAMIESLQTRNFRKTFSEFGFEVDKIDFKPIYQFLDDLRNAPTEYFEAKPRRAVGLNEFAIAVIPKNTSKEARDALKKYGLDLYEYDENVKGKLRQDVVNKALSEADDMLFQAGDKTDYLKESSSQVKTADQFVEKIRAEGKMVYHGSTQDFKNFSFKYLGTNGTSEGKGFYFTNRPEVARGYSRGATIDASGTGGRIYEAFVDIKKPLSYTGKSITEPKLRKFIRALDPDGSGYLSNWGDVSFEGYENVLNKAVKQEMRGDTDVNIISSIVNAEGGNPESVYPILKKTLGYDGIIVGEKDAELKRSRNELWKKKEASFEALWQVLSRAYGDKDGNFIPEAMDDIQFGKKSIDDFDRIPNKKQYSDLFARVRKHHKDYADSDAKYTKTRVWGDQIISIAFSDEQIYTPKRLKAYYEGEKNNTGDLYQLGDKLRESPFYLKSSRVIAQKIPNRATGEQIRKTLLNNGVKPDEIKWVLDDLFAQKGDEQITKAELLEHIAQNKAVQIEDVTLGKAIPEEKLRPFKERREVASRNLADAKSDVHKAFIHSEVTPQYRQSNTTEQAIDVLNSNFARVRYVDIALKEAKNLFGELSDRQKASIEELVYRGGKFNSAQEDYDRYSTLESPTAFHSYKSIPGGENYREVIITLPKLGGRSYKSNHWKPENPVAHIRMDDRVDADGNRVLFVHEMQSDWNREGREHGFGTPDYSSFIAKKDDTPFPSFDDWLNEKRSHVADKSPLSKETIDTLRRIYEVQRDKDRWVVYDARGGALVPTGNKFGSQAEAEWSARSNAEIYSGLIPDAPFVRKWQELVAKKVVEEAATGGYDRIAWAKGEQVANMFDLRKQIKELHWRYASSGAKNAPKYYEIVGIDHNVNEVIRKQVKTDDDLKNLVGKTAAEKIISQANEYPNDTISEGVLSGDNLAIGGEWAQSLYDAEFPSIFNKIGKRWGSKSGESKIATNPDKPQYKMVEMVLGGGGYKVFDTSKNEAVAYFPPSQEKQAIEYVAKKNNEGLHSVNALDITPEMRRAILSEGQELFQTGGDLFSGDEAKREMPKGKLVKKERSTVDSKAALEESLQNYAAELKRVKNVLTLQPSNAEALKKQAALNTKIAEVRKQIGELDSDLFNPTEGPKNQESFFQLGGKAKFGIDKVLSNLEKPKWDKPYIDDVVGSKITRVHGYRGDLSAVIFSDRVEVFRGMGKEERHFPQITDNILEDEIQIGDTRAGFKSKDAAKQALIKALVEYEKKRYERFKSDKRLRDEFPGIAQDRYGLETDAGVTIEELFGRKTEPKPQQGSIFDNPQAGAVRLPVPELVKAAKWIANPATATASVVQRGFSNSLSRLNKFESGKEFVQKTITAETRAKMMTGDLHSTLDADQHKLNKQDIEWLNGFDGVEKGRANSIALIEGIDNPAVLDKAPSQRVVDFAHSFREVTDKIASKAEEVGVKVSVDGEQRDFERIDSYFPHWMTRAAHDAVMAQDGPVWDAMLEKLKTASGDDATYKERLAQLKSYSEGEIDIHREGSLEKPRLAFLPDYVTVDGKRVKVLESNVFDVADDMIERHSRRLAIIEQFGQGDKQFNEYYRKFYNEDKHLAFEFKKFIAPVMQGMRVDLLNPQGFPAQVYRPVSALINKGLLSAAVLSQAGGVMAVPMQFGVRRTASAMFDLMKAHRTGEIQEMRKLRGFYSDILKMLGETDAFTREGFEGVDGNLAQRGLRKANRGMDSYLRNTLGRADRFLNDITSLTAVKSVNEALTVIKRGDTGLLKKGWGTDAEGQRRMLKRFFQFTDEQIDGMIERGKLNDEEKARIVQRAPASTNAAGMSVLDRPAWMHLDIAKHILAFSSYVQAIGRYGAWAVKEAKENGNLRPIIGLLVGGAIGGEIEIGVKNWFNDREREDKNFSERLFQDILRAGVLGIAGSFYQTYDYTIRGGGNPVAEQLSPPPIDALAQLGKAIAKAGGEKSLAPIYYQSVLRSLPAARIGNLWAERAILGDPEASARRLIRDNMLKQDGKTKDRWGRENIKLVPRVGRENTGKMLLKRADPVKLQKLYEAEHPKTEPTLKKKLTKRTYPYARP